MKQHDSGRQVGTTENYGDRGVWVPDGLNARDIMLGAKTLERDFEIAPYRSRAIVRAVLSAICQGRDDGERAVFSSEDSESGLKAS